MCSKIAHVVCQIVVNHCLPQSTMKICHLASSSTVEIPGGGGSTMKPPGMENPVEWGFKLEKPSMGGMDIFWNHTMLNTNVELKNRKISEKHIFQ